MLSEDRLQSLADPPFEDQDEIDRMTLAVLAQIALELMWWRENGHKVSPYGGLM